MITLRHFQEIDMRQTIKNIKIAEIPKMIAKLGIGTIDSGMRERNIYVLVRSQPLHT